MNEHEISRLQHVKTLVAQAYPADDIIDLLVSAYQGTEPETYKTLVTHYIRTCLKGDIVNSKHWALEKINAFIKELEIPTTRRPS